MYKTPLLHLFQRLAFVANINHFAFNHKVVILKKGRIYLAGLLKNTFKSSFMFKVNCEIYFNILHNKI